MSEAKTEKPKAKRKRRSGPGQIIPRGKNKWFVRVQGKLSPTGRREDHSKLIHGTKTDAEKYLHAILSERDKGMLVEASAMLLSDYIDKWLEMTRSKISISTHDNYEANCNLYIKPYLGGIKLRALRPLDIETLFVKLSDKALSPITVRYVFTVLSAALNKALRLRLIAQNPCKLVDPPRVPRKEMQALSPEQAARFVETARPSKHGLIFILAILTGLRPSELLGLQWKDLDFDAGLLTIRRNIIWQKGGGYYVGDLKTAVSRRAIPLPQILVSDLAAHRRAQLASRMKQAGQYEDNDLIFATSLGTPLRSGNLSNRHFKPLLLQAGLPSTLRLYDLRHSCATLLLAAGESPKVMSERLGHSRTATTLDIYSHVLPGMQKAASDKLAGMIFQTTKDPDTQKG